jgi:DNA-binding transcriptional ArsR family regulator
MELDISEDIQLLAEKRAAYCKALGSPARVLILWILKERETTLREIALAIGASTQSTIRHLNILQLNNLVTFRRAKNNIYYQLAENDQTKQCPVLKNKPEAIWDETYQT